MRRTTWILLAGACTLIVSLWWTFGPAMGPGPRADEPTAAAATPTPPPVDVPPAFARPTAVWPLESTDENDRRIRRFHAELERAQDQEGQARDRHYESAASILSELRPLLHGSAAERARYAALEASLDAAAPR